MNNYLKGYREGLKLAQEENAEQAYEERCGDIERKLAQLAATIYRRRPEQCRRETSEYLAQSQYFIGLCDGYHRARRGEIGPDS